LKKIFPVPNALLLTFFQFYSGNVPTFTLLF
jgi:hypothetical protein